MEINGTFNFSLDEAYKILVEHRGRNTNVDKVNKHVLIAVYSLHTVLSLFANLVVNFVVARRPRMHIARNHLTSNPYVPPAVIPIAMRDAT
ncbi:neuropeptide Y receptor activity protein [Homalodisca vitripennis]|nr:neuropeptide Y receptor activity protein [Homalodisca vitripennis]